MGRCDQCQPMFRCRNTGGLDNGAAALWFSCLGTGYIDLYQAHRPNALTDVEETLGALTDVVGRDPRPDR